MLSLRQLASLAVVTAACSGPPSGGVDGGDGPSASGLELRWAAAPAVPGPTSAEARIDELHLSFSSLRVVGDAAPADPRTTRGRLTLEWNDRPPEPTLFADAPAGRYGQLELGVSGGHEALELHGAVLIDGTWWRLEIEDESALPVTIPIALEVAPGAPVTDTITLDAGGLIGAVDWRLVPPDLAGVRRVTSGDPAIAAVRAAVTAGLSAASVAPQ